MTSPEEQVDDQGGITEGDRQMDQNQSDDDLEYIGRRVETIPNDESYDYYQPPAGFKLIPEDYIGVEPTMYAMMLKALGSGQAKSSPQEIRVQMPQAPQEEPDRVFEIRMLQSLVIGDIGYNFQRHEEFKYCPSKRYLEVGGDRYTTLRSFLNMWNGHFGPRPDPNLRRSPFFLILNPESCPPIEESLGKKVLTRFRTHEERVRYEESRGDAATQRVRVPGESREYSLDIHTPRPVDPRDVDRNPDETLHPERRPGMYQDQGLDYARQDAANYRNQVRQQAYQNPQGYPPQQAGAFYQPADPQAEMQRMMHSANPVMPPRAGIVDPSDGLTPRARMIKAMSGDQIQRPVQRQTMPVSVGGYEPPETVENFPVAPGVMGGGQIVSQIPGGPADEAIEKARMLDMEAQRLQSYRTNY